MNIVQISTYDKTGGAAIACWRTADALCTVEADTKLLVKYSRSPHPMTLEARQFGWGRLNEWLERFAFVSRAVSREVWFHFSTGLTGQDISQLDAVKAADILHFHWINKGFLSLDSMGRLALTGKPLVWTIHDMWAFTGGCHYSGACEKYKTGCHSCPFLKQPYEADLSKRIFEAKRRFFGLANLNLTIISPSQWLADVARESLLLQGIRIVHIPNPINTKVYSPTDPLSARFKLKLPTDKKLILFAAMNVNDRRKGFHLLEESLGYFKQHLGDKSSNYELVVIGKAKAKVFDHLPFKVNYLGVTQDESLIIDAYNACDVVVLPSLQDNLPNTAVEAMACGKPIVAFKIGGIPEMIEHRGNGWLAEAGNTEDFAKGLDWVLADNEKYHYLCKSARQKAVKKYDYTVVSKAYSTLYQELLNDTVVLSATLD